MKTIKEFKTLQELHEFERKNSKTLSREFKEYSEADGLWFGFFNTTDEYITEKEIKDIDDRITDCMVECDEGENYYYAKIWFSYVISGIDNNSVQRDGRDEFSANTKEELISEIKEFMRESKGAWSIVK